MKIFSIFVSIPVAFIERGMPIKCVGCYLINRTLYSCLFFWTRSTPQQRGRLAFKIVFPNLSISQSSGTAVWFFVEHAYLGDTEFSCERNFGCVFKSSLISWRLKLSEIELCFQNVVIVGLRVFKIKCYVLLCEITAGLSGGRSETTMSFWSWTDLLDQIRYPLCNAMITWVP